MSGRFGETLARQSVGGEWRERSRAALDAADERVAADRAPVGQRKVEGASAELKRRRGRVEATTLEDTG